MFDKDLICTNNPYPVLVSDKDQNIVFYNPAALLIFPLLKKNDKKLSDILGFEISDNNVNEELINTRWFRFCAKTDIRGYLHIYGFDITDNKELKKTMQTSEDFYLKILDDAPALIWRSDETGQCNWFNKEWLEFTGRKLEQELGNGWAEGVHKEDFERCLDIYLTNFKNKTPFDMEYRIRYHDGNYRWIIDYGKPIYDFKNRFLGFIGYCFDISEQKDYEEKLKIALKKAQESDLLKSSFLANMSHEIRTPMNAILGFTELLSLDCEKEDHRQYLKIITSSGESLLYLINDILDLSKIESGEFKLIKNNCILNEILENLKITFKKMAEFKEKEIDIIKVLPEDNRIVNTFYTDSERLMQVFRNLINNSLKFTDKGHISFGYDISNDGKFLVFFVKDTGRGMKQDFVDKVFSRFIQEDKTLLKRQGGTGLGLAISKGIVELLGGKIWFKTEENIGTEFFFTIPYEKNGPEDLIKSNSKEISSDFDFSSLKLRVLVVEDDNNNFELIKTIMFNNKIEVLRASNGNEALKIVREDIFIDIILMDMKMPGIDGYSVTKTIKNEFPDISIIAVTAFAMENDRERCFEAGCDDYIEKPVKRNLLLKKIQKCTLK